MPLKMNLFKGLNMKRFVWYLCKRRWKKRHIFGTILFMFFTYNVFRYMYPPLIGGISCPNKEYPLKAGFGVNSGLCQIIHVGAHCYTEEEVHGLVFTIKSLLSHTRTAVELYIVTTTETHRVLSQYIDTWQLQHVDVHFYISDSKLSTLDYLLTEYLGPQPEAWIILQPGAYFSADLETLRLHAKSSQRVIEPVISSQHELDYTEYVPAALILRPKSLEGSINCLQKDLSVSSLEVPVRYAHVIKCRLKEFTSLSVKKKALDDLYFYKPHVYNGVHTRHGIGDENLDKIYEEVQSLDVYRLRIRLVDSSCKYTFQRKIIPVSQHTLSLDPCYEFRYSACFSYITHLYFYNLQPSAMSGPVRPDSQVSAVIQLQYNRFTSLRRIIQRWRSPIHIVLYLTQIESQLVRKQLMTDDSLTRDNIYYHVVYKHLVYDPINMLRNVGIREVRTEYLFVFDVDFVPIDSLDKRLMDVARQYRGKSQKALIVPAFEGLLKDYVVPNSKNQLLLDMELSRLIPYHQGFNQFSKGHAPTMYNKWMTAVEPYEVEHQTEFEPYVMLRTLDSPLFYEIQLERMGDKFTYVLEIYKKGLPLVVVDSVFMVHLPHPQSAAHQLATSAFHRCFKYYFRTISEKLDNLYYRKNG